MTAYKPLSRMYFLFCMAFLLGATITFTHPHSVVAAPRLDGYSLSVSASNTSYAFATNSQYLTATLTYPTPSTDAVDCRKSTCFFEMNGQRVEYTNTVPAQQGLGRLVFQYALPETLSPGTYTILAGFTSTQYATTIYSNPLTLTVTKITPNAVYLGLFSTDHPFWTAGQTIQLFPSFQDMTIDQKICSDWKTGTMTLNITGPQNITYTDLPIDKNTGAISVTLPTVSGDYKAHYTFNGSSDVDTATDVIEDTFKITLGKPVTIQLYSTPTTTAYNVKTEYYVVVKGVAGFPPPSGQIEFTLGTVASQLLPLQTDGTLLADVTWIYYINGSNLGVNYYGDYTYAASGQGFSITNPPIPTTGGTGNTGGTGVTPTPSIGASSTATATAIPTPTPTDTNTTTTMATATPTPTPTATAAATATVTAIATSTPTLSANSTATPVIHAQTTAHHITSASPPVRTWLVGVGAVFLVGLFCGGFFFFRRRKESANTSVLMNQPDPSKLDANAPTQSNTMIEHTEERT